MCCSGYLLLLGNVYAPKTRAKMERDIVLYARKKYTVSVNGISVSLS